MGFTLETGVSAAAVFLQGILSFFSPCVLPLVPLYIGYLAGGAKSVDADGTVRFYDLQGRYIGTSLDGQPKGIYICNGKKVIKK